MQFSNRRQRCLTHVNAEDDASISALNSQIHCVTTPIVQLHSLPCSTNASLHDFSGEHQRSLLGVTQLAPVGPIQRAQRELVGEYHQSTTPAAHRDLSRLRIDASSERPLQRMSALWAFFRHLEGKDHGKTAAMEGWGRIRTRASAGPCSILTICALNVERRVSLPTRCSIANSWNTLGESLKTAIKGEASVVSTRSQNPESSRRSGRALCFSKPFKQTAMSFARGKTAHHAYSVASLAPIRLPSQKTRSSDVVLLLIAM